MGRAVDSVHHRHTNVHENEVVAERVGLEYVDGLATVLRDSREHTQLLQRPLRAHLRHLVVLHNQHGARGVRLEADQHLHVLAAAAGVLSGRLARGGGRVRRLSLPHGGGRLVEVEVLERLLRQFRHDVVVLGVDVVELVLPRRHGGLHVRRGGGGLHGQLELHGQHHVVAHRGHQRAPHLLQVVLGHGDAEPQLGPVLVEHVGVAGAGLPGLPNRGGLRQLQRVLLGGGAGVAEDEGEGVGGLVLRHGEAHLPVRRLCDALLQQDAQHAEQPVLVSQHRAGVELEGGGEAHAAVAEPVELRGKAAERLRELELRLLEVVQHLLLEHERVADILHEIAQPLHGEAQLREGHALPGGVRPRGRLVLLLQRVDVAGDLMAGSAHLVDHLAQEGLLDLAELLELLLLQLEARLADQPLSVVADEASRVVEGPVDVPVDVAVNQQMLDTPILLPETNRDIVDRVACAEVVEDLEHQLLLVRAELRDRLPDVLFGSVPQHVHLHLVRPYHIARASKPVHGDGCVVEKVLELGFHFQPFRSQLRHQTTPTKRELAVPRFGELPVVGSVNGILG
mmetsp:Transcript_7269/g.14809  ORF Transcript_7269/g.14809 Transcript_7269/m.14809 type:complete len:567 (+) Transcript_7269:723-2423(+)